MANLSDIRRRIGSVKNTQQITRAMKMVAAAKLRGAEERLRAGRPYAIALDGLVDDLYRRTNLKGFPLLEGHEEVKKVEYVLVNSDRGLCGAFNATLIRHLQHELAECEGKYEQVTLTIIGRKALDYFKRRPVTIRKTYTDLLKDVDLDLAIDVGDELLDAFMSGEIDEIRLIYNEFVSAISQRVVTRRLIPVELPDVGQPDGEEAEVDYKYDPTKEEILKSLLPRQVNYQLYRAFLESFAAEMGARMSAMDSATTNAGEMIDRLTLKYNRARQDAITTELMDIVNGAEALK
jgi:F-type H+-transporting ATPase subunit gamma